MSEIQSVVFLGRRMNVMQQHTWLRKHNLIPMKKVHVVGGEHHVSHRWRIRDPKKFSRFITKKITPDIDLVIGFP